MNTKPRAILRAKEAVMVETCRCRWRPGLEGGVRVEQAHLDYNGCKLHGPDRFMGFPATNTDPACGFACPRCGQDTPHSHGAV